MPIEATKKSAALAGAWAAFGLVPFEIWMDQHPVRSVSQHNLLWLLAAAVFFFVPMYFLVIGPRNEPFERNWIVDADERAPYGVVAKRMLVWFAAVAVVGGAWSGALSLILH